MKKVFLVLAAFLFAALACTKDSGSGSKSHTDKESGSAYDPTVSTIKDAPSVSDDKVLESVISSYKEKVKLLVGGRAKSYNGIGNSALGVPGCAGTINSIERLGIPRITLADGPAGSAFVNNYPDSSL